MTAQDTFIGFSRVLTSLQWSGTDLRHACTPFSGALQWARFTPINRNGDRR